MPLRVQGDIQEPLVGAECTHATMQPDECLQRRIGSLRQDFLYGLIALREARGNVGLSYPAKRRGPSVCLSPADVREISLEDGLLPARLAHAHAPKEMHLGTPTSMFIYFEIILFFWIFSHWSKQPVPLPDCLMFGACV
jgi:hypothetical protein